MNIYSISKEEKINLLENLKKDYEDFKRQGLKLDMSRGKPSRKQLDLSRDMLSIITSRTDVITDSGVDCCNYGELFGIDEGKRLFSEILNVNKENIIVGGNSSLNMMFDVIATFMENGVQNCKPWNKQENIKFLCPSPGYDRHFAILKYFNIAPITIPMTKSGPDMNLIEKMVSDDTIKGIWCVPKYSNPQGITYSDETVKRFAKLKPKALDFRIFWDNAYAVHDLVEDGEVLLNIMDECKAVNNENLPIIFCSTSKITFPGSGIAALATSSENLKVIKKRYMAQTIGHDKINQLRHVHFLKDLHGIKKHMQKHREILKPKFDVVLNKLNENFQSGNFIKWTNPKGGYFISVDVFKGCAKKVVRLCLEAGLKLTPAGATFPNGIDENDSNIRIAPSYPETDELSKAMDLFCLSVKIAVLERLIIMDK